MKSNKIKLTDLSVVSFTIPTDMDCSKIKGGYTFRTCFEDCRTIGDCVPVQPK